MGILRGTRNLLLATGIAFLVQMMLPPHFTIFFSLIPERVVRFEMWRLFTYIFLHGNFWHLFVNMYAVFLFGNELEYFWGMREYLKYYFICGIGAGFIYTLFKFNSSIPVIGASGAVFGLLLAYGMLFPERRLIIFPFFIPVKAKTLVIGYGLLEFLLIFSHSGNIAHLAHVGGLLVGYIYLRYRRRRLY